MVYFPRSDIMYRNIFCEHYINHYLTPINICLQNLNNQLLKSLALFQEKAVRLINFQSQISPSINRFKEKKVLKISDYKYILFVRSSLRILNLQIFNNIFTPLSINCIGINHSHSSRAAKYHLLDIPQKECTYYGNYSMTSIVSVTWIELLRNTNQSFLDYRIWWI